MFGVHHRQQFAVFGVVEQKHALDHGHEMFGRVVGIDGDDLGGQRARFAVDERGHGEMQSIVRPNCRGQTLRHLDVAQCQLAEAILDRVDGIVDGQKRLHIAPGQNTHCRFPLVDLISGHASNRAEMTVVAARPSRAGQSVKRT